MYVRHVTSSVPHCRGVAATSLVKNCLHAQCGSYTCTHVDYYIYFRSTSGGTSTGTCTTQHMGMTSPSNCLASETHTKFTTTYVIEDVFSKGAVLVYVLQNFTCRCKVGSSFAPLSCLYSIVQLKTCTKCLNIYSNDPQWSDHH